MEEKTLLAEIETEKKKQVEKRFKKYIDAVEVQPNTDQSQNQIQSALPRTASKKTAFSSAAFENRQQPQNTPVTAQQPAQSSAESQSLVIETPNYDFIESLSESQHEKIFIQSDDDAQTKAKPKTARWKKALICTLFAIFGVWGIVNIATIDSLNNQISQLTSEYNMNLISYLNNLHNLDATNSQNMENLFETIPAEQTPPTSIGSQSNWFDRFCNFISGLFGG